MTGGRPVALASFTCCSSYSYDVVVDVAMMRPPDLEFSEGVSLVPSALVPTSCLRNAATPSHECTATAVSPARFHPSPRP